MLNPARDKNEGTYPGGGSASAAATATAATTAAAVLERGDSACGKRRGEDNTTVELLLHGASRQQDCASGKRHSTRTRARDIALRDCYRYVREGTTEQDSVLGRPEYNTRARQMTPLPGQRKQNASSSQLENVPKGTKEQESLLGQPKYNTQARQMTQLPGEQEQKVPSSQPDTATGRVFFVPESIRTPEQEDMLERPEGTPKPGERVDQA